MTLTASIELTLGSLHLDVDVEVGEAVVAVIGPNGAGKTSLLRALAGLLPIDRGRIVINGAVVEDPAAGIRLPPEARRVGVVFQDHRLFDNLTALENVAFGLRARGAPRREARCRAAQWLGRVGLDVADQRPRQLSGGQAQRVALARALATEPAVLLLDEPLAAVDAGTRSDLRSLLRSELRRYPGNRIVITHDPIDAAVLADRLLVLEHGTITHNGPLAEVTARPKSPWVATMVGLNLLTGIGDGTTITLPSGALMTASTGPVRGPVFVAFRPNAVTLHRTRPDGSARNLWPAEISEVATTGDRARIRLNGPVPLIAEVTADAVAQLHLADHGPIWAAVKATEVDVYPT